ncbi:MAG: aldo/keto reductase [Anaerolineales bacterium]|nr:aldo/keto reductase [Anaerolineales bacterium]
MQTKRLGRTELQVSLLGAGLSEIGNQLTKADIEQASQVLNAALDGGINFLDTAACYGISEETIGATIAHRRDEFILATKAGHVAGGYKGEDWTAQTITDSIERSLKRMKTDHLDIVQLHSCSVEVLEQGDAIEALLAAQAAGKTRFVGYSGDNEAAAWAIASGIFDTLQTSFNLVEQRARTRLFEHAAAQDMGIIIKRPIANGAWGATACPSNYASQYFERAQAMDHMNPPAGAPTNRILLALGFTLAHEDVDTIIVGTKNPAHMQANLDWIANELPIDPAVVAELHNRFETLDSDWVQLT